MSACFITGAAATAAAPTFSDVPEGHWAYAYVAEAAEQGWVSGVGGGLFAPDRQVTEFCAAHAPRFSHGVSGA